MYKITEDILQATLNYLTTKPHREVVVLIGALQRLEKDERAVAEEGGFKKEVKK